MRKELRTRKDGSHYYSFLYFDKTSNKRIRLSKEYIRQRFGGDITTDENAAIAARLLDAEYESLKLRLQMRAAWEVEFYNFKALLDVYTRDRKKLAPNSYKNNLHYLKHYVLHYFLNISRCNNIDFWPDFFGSFKEWLENEAYLVKQPERIISYGAKNHCIKALNTFMRQLYQEKVIRRLVLCEKFPSHKLNERSVDDVISEKEMNAVYQSLMADGFQKEAVFYRMLYYTGLRFNEGLGISIGDMHEGDVQHENLRSLLMKHDITYSGYLVLLSQPDHPTKGLRNPQGRIDRKPLKSRKKISEKHARVVAIPDRQLWADLVVLYNLQVEEMSRGTWGRNPSDYALFDGLDRTTATRRLHEAYAKVGLRYRSWHCCRHSCATSIIGRTGDYSLARLWLGHNSPSVVERYVHVHQAIVRMALKKDKDGFKKIES